MRMKFATQFVCDACRATAEEAEPADRFAGVPAGWFGAGDLPGWIISSPLGARFSEICPACMALPFGEVIRKIIWGDDDHG
jgi:hypothetical protein